VTAALARNDIRQYDELAGAWRDPSGAFSALHWLADVRARLVPAADPCAPLLLDVACGGGLLATRVDGYCHVGVDLSRSALEVARADLVPVQGDARQLPVTDAAADVVVAGEIFEHVEDLDGTVAEIARVLRPGGVVVFDTINDTAFARLALVTIGERLPGGPPRNIHDPRLFVGSARLRSLFEWHGMTVTMSGLRPSLVDYARFLVDRRRTVRMVPTGSLAGVYHGVARKPER
jgi:2-polyprenyl-6-hydroxyphenyl methylase/3-demethylubiquinone-9 3-methyltransferase